MPVVIYVQGHGFPLAVHTDVDALVDDVTGAMKEGSVVPIPLPMGGRLVLNGALAPSVVIQVTADPTGGPKSH